MTTKTSTRRAKLERIADLALAQQWAAEGRHELAARMFAKHGIDYAPSIKDIALVK
jgi:hypothetical protein